ncbi:hypothetical protein FALBO_13596 [Fusarium albosuccineum]|uniref:JmjC domain-containing protein n=1 Tax=Fusarium albosuccineum TaxID=1237068 RepID=A0A8H4P585_9HYPO|nr:hypothetical protein FALBO_13596 [Fusarium albosuccineum]
MLSNSITNLVDQYHTAAKKYYNEALHMLQSQVESSALDTRTREDVTQILYMLKESKSQTPLTVEEALQLKPSDGLDKKLVVCSEDGARQIFDKGPPCFPVLVAESGHQQRITIDWFLDVLGTRSYLDIHDFGKNTKEQDRVPERMPSSKAINMFRGRQKGELQEGQNHPLNFLNLSRVKDNVVLTFLANRKDFKILELSREENGKREFRPESIDLDESTSFHLLASRGAVHLPHVDHHGVYTTVFNEEGHKLWLMWPGLGLDGLKEWRSTGQVPRNGIPIYIPPGYTLIQPPGTLHAPITITDCLMTGTMHWHSSQLLDILRYTKAEIEDPEMTNEPFSRQFIKKMTMILDLWQEGSKAYEWPPIESFNECRDILEWLKEGCDCHAMEDVTMATTHAVTTQCGETVDPRLEDFASIADLDSG